MFFEEECHGVNCALQLLCFQALCEVFKTRTNYRVNNQMGVTKFQRAGLFELIAKKSRSDGDHPRLSHRQEHLVPTREATVSSTSTYQRFSPSDFCAYASYARKTAKVSSAQSSLHPTTCAVTSDFPGGRRTIPLGCLHIHDEIPCVSNPTTKLLAGERGEGSSSGG